MSSCISRDEASHAVPDEDNMGRIDPELLTFSGWSKKSTEACASSSVWVNEKAPPLPHAPRKNGTSTFQPARRMEYARSRFFSLPGKPCSISTVGCGRHRTQCRVPNTSWPHGSECQAKPSSPDTRDQEVGQRSPPPELVERFPVHGFCSRTTGQSRAATQNSQIVS
jgi:hypothetical protein